MRDRQGNLYGTPSYGGISAGPVLIDSEGLSFGVVYKVDATGRESVLYRFTGQTDGNRPEAGLIGDDAGNLYGTTYQGGNLNGCLNYGCGTVYKLDATTYNETTLYSFTGKADGSSPEAGVIVDAAGNVYGTT